jgi:hypothetical protein
MTATISGRGRSAAAPGPGEQAARGDLVRQMIRSALSRPLFTLLVFGVLLLATAGSAAYVVARPSASQSHAFPQSTAMEQQLGVRFSRLAMVGDGGLLELSFVVLDVDKATSFEASLAKPPIIVSEDRPGGTKRISVMKQGHNLVAGLTYYLVYENTRGAVRSGGHATIHVGRLRLEHVPVL